MIRVLNIIKIFYIELTSDDMEGRGFMLFELLIFIKIVLFLLNFLKNYF